MRHFTDLVTTSTREPMRLWHCQFADAERYYGQTVVMAPNQESAIALSRALFPVGMLGIRCVEPHDHYLNMLNKKVLPTPEEAYDRRL